MAQKNIPQGWKVVPTGDIFSFVKSYAFSRENLVNNTMNDEDIGNIHYGDIHSTFSAPSIDLTKVSIPKVKDKNFSPKQGDLLKDGDLIMADASEDYAGVGITISLHGLKNKKVTGGLHTFVLRDADNITDPYFRQYIFRNPEIRNMLQKIASGVSVYSLSKTAVSKLLLPIPPLPEQKRIVAVLETWDGVIQKLTKKIKIKKQIKKKLIQELLTGKVRLCGFKNTWQRILLNDVGRIISGGTPAKMNDKFWKGDIPWISSSDLIDEDIRQVFIHRYITREAVSESATNIIPAKSIVMVSRVGVGKLIVNEVSLCTSQDFQSLVIKDSNKYNPYFVAYQLSIELQKLLLRNQGTSIKGFLKDDLRKLSIHAPEIIEQRAIADILTAADKEIARLEQKLKLVRHQKTYLLNHLMTGSIRVPDKTPNP